jgi:hypothetical protein
MQYWKVYPNQVLGEDALERHLEKDGKHVSTKEKKKIGSQTGDVRVKRGECSTPP